MDKAKNLLSSGSVAELKFLEEEAGRDVEKAQLDRSQADLEKAKLDVEFTTVKSPINGKVGVNEVDVGNLVGANENTLLTHVVNDESIYVYFNIPERDVLKYKRIYSGKNGGADVEKEEAKALMSLADETDFPHEGTIDYIDPRVDPGTGTMRARAVFPNPKGLLSPGLFARIRVPVATRKALLIPEIAVGIDQRGEYALVVGKDNLVEYRPVKTGQLVDRMRVIEKGLNPQDWIVVQGVQKARPGSKVTPIKEEIRPSATTGASSAPSSSK
jgi:RND family efflux transporter MFP subunit